MLRRSTIIHVQTVCEIENDGIRVCQIIVITFILETLVTITEEINTSSSPQLTRTELQDVNNMLELQTPATTSYDHPLPSQTIEPPDEIITEANDSEDTDDSGGGYHYDRPQIRFDTRFDDE